ncbi:MAG: ATP-grasp domain-containing protein [Gilvibacter sp.]
MKHVIALLPFKNFEETFTTLLDVIKRADMEVTIAGNFEKVHLADYPYVKDVIYIPSSDMFVDNQEKLFAILDDFYAKKPFDAIINFFEEYVELAASITSRYGLAGNSERTALLTRNKHAMREVLYGYGCRVPHFIKVESLQEFVRAVTTIGLPCVAKPLDAMASEGVIKIESLVNLDKIYDELMQANQGIKQTQHSKLLVEEYADGPEVSVEGIVTMGKLKIMGITEKTTEEEPFFNEIMHIHPAPLPERLQEEIYTLTKQAVKALGIEYGGVHLEAKLSKKGPTIIEVASRLGGDAIPSLMALAKGYDPYHYVFMSGVDIPVQLNATRNKFAGIRFIQAPKDGTLTDIYFDEKELSAIPGVINKRIFGRIGEHIARPPEGRTNRLAYVTIAGRSYEQVKQNLLLAENALKYVIEDKVLQPEPQI